MSYGTAGSPSAVVMRRDKGKFYKTQEFMNWDSCPQCVLISHSLFAVGSNSARFMHACSARLTGHISSSCASHEYTAAFAWYKWQHSL